MKKGWLEGRWQEVREWIQSIKSNAIAWQVLSGQTRGDILRFESAVALEGNGDIEKARALSQEANCLWQSDDASLVDALIAFADSGIDGALAVLSSKTDIGSRNLRAAFMLQAGK